MERRNESTSAIALANFFIYNNDYGLKEGLVSVALLNRLCWYNCMKLYFCF